jgi:hypothetical protein
MAIFKEGPARGILKEKGVSRKKKSRGRPGRGAERRGYFNEL